MNSDKLVGLIECGTPGKGYFEASAVAPQDLPLKKAYVVHEGTKTALRQRFPELELVLNCEAIFEDDAIGLVLISSPESAHRPLIGTALKANKQVQVV